MHHPGASPGQGLAPLGRIAIRENRVVKRILASKWMVGPRIRLTACYGKASHLRGFSIERRAGGRLWVGEAQDSLGRPRAEVVVQKALLADFDRDARAKLEPREGPEDAVLPGNGRPVENDSAPIATMRRLRRARSRRGRRGGAARRGRSSHERGHRRAAPPRNLGRSRTVPIRSPGSGSRSRRPCRSERGLQSSSSTQIRRPEACTCTARMSAAGS